MIVELDSWGMSMPYSSTQEKALETLFVIKRGVVNLHLYPPNNPVVINNIEKIYESLTAIFEKEDSVIFAESDRNLIINDELMSQKNLGNPHIAIFLVLMINWKMKSITFMKGLEKSELTPFLEILAKKPEEIKIKGGLEQVVSEKKMPHILFNRKNYSAKY